jgi:hypothetical protein
LLTEAQAHARDRMEILRDDLAERARTAVNTTYEELLDQAVTAGGEDLVEKAALIGTDLIVTRLAVARRDRNGGLRHRQRRGRRDAQ